LVIESGHHPGQRAKQTESLCSRIKKQDAPFAEDRNSFGSPDHSVTIHRMSLKTFALTLLTLAFMFSIATSSVSQTSSLTFPGPNDEFIVYYHNWPTGDDVFYKKMGARYKLIILNTDNLVPPKDIENIPEKVLAYKRLRIKMLHDSGAMVFAYQSIGEENVEANGNQAYPGDKLGPCSCENSATCCKTGFASYYIDDGKGRPVIHLADNYASAAVNAGNPVWRTMMSKVAAEQIALGCTGLFLDTLDTAVDYTWTQAGMMKLLEELYQITPNIIVNRGISLLDTPSAAAYKKYTWAIMFENFFTEWDGKKKEGVKSKYWDGNLSFIPKLKDKNVLVVDFATCAQLEKKGGVVSQQRDAVRQVNSQNGTKWPNYIGDHNFAKVRYQFKCEK
jgi:endo-alpha-1,4-polygalactosaminidase (GH114 family)